MLPPAKLCRQHLLGEHVEIHMLAGTLRRGKSVAGHLSRGQLEPQNALARHAALAAEMTRRGYRHESPLDMPQDTPIGRVDRTESERTLRERCAACTERMTP